MKFPRHFCLLALSLSLSASTPPPTAAEPVAEILHGVEIVDPYRWLEDQSSPRTRAWLEEQSAYTERVLAALPGQEKLRRLLEPMFRTESYTLPEARAGAYYFMRRLAQENRASICRRASLTAPDEVLISPESVSADPAVSINLARVSDDGQLLIYTVRQGGEDEVEVRFFDLKTRRTLPDRLPRGRYFGLALRPDGKGIYYSALHKEGTRVFYHELGSPAASDRFIFSKGKGLLPTDNVSISEDGTWLVLGLNYGTSSRNEIRVKNLAQDGPVRDVAVGVDAQFRARVIGDSLYLWTNWKAPNWRLLRLSLAQPDLRRAQTIIAERDLPLSAISYVGGRIFASYLENVQPRIYIYGPDGKPLGEFSRPGVGNTGTPTGAWSAREAFFSFSSFATPITIYRYDFASRRSHVWHQVKLGIDTADFETRQVWYTSKDGTRIPMWLVHRKNLPRDSNRPVYLTGYGGFNISRTPAFTNLAVLWASLGGVYALPNLRGGGEFGERWHQAAMFEKKQNTFDDFIAAAEYLIAHHYTNPQRIAVAGGSNGGLLVGAMLTQRPDLIAAVHCSVPLLDMIRYHKFLLGQFWIGEYGSADHPQQFPYLLRYSPYHNVKDGVPYPAVIFSTGDSDTRVDPLHARKMTALLQRASSSGKPVVLKYDTKAGHSGGKPVDQQIRELAEIQAFLLHALRVPLDEE